MDEGGSMQPPGGSVTDPAATALTLRDRLRHLHALVGRPTADRLKEHADRRGHSVSRAALAAAVGAGNAGIRWATVEAVIDACASYAASRQDPLPPEETAMLSWRQYFDQEYPGQRAGI